MTVAERMESHLPAGNGLAAQDTNTGIIERRPFPGWIGIPQNCETFVGIGIDGHVCFHWDISIGANRQSDFRRDGV